MAKHKPGSDLTIKQKKAAADLRAKRPLCLPGTNDIIRASEAREWYNLVGDAAVEYDISPEQADAFFNLCGVAD
jgi:hypothetical protein